MRYLRHDILLAPSTLAKTFIILALALSAIPFAYAQETTSAIRGTIVEENGSALVGATVTVLYGASGATRTESTNSQGIFDFDGLRPGGPYIVTVSASGYSTLRVEDLHLSLAHTSELNLVLAPYSTGEIEEIVVTASAAGVTQDKAGQSSVYGEDVFSRIAAASRDPKEFAKLDPRVTVAGAGSMSIMGINQRFNSLTIDGIRLNDDFGLNRSGYAGRANPVSIDAIEQVVLNVAEYDVEASQYLGGNMNIITKSGSNEWHGSAYGFTRSANTSGDLPGGVEQDFDDVTFGATLGGPIIKNRLFFFVNYEEFDTEVPLGSSPADAGITDADIAEFTRILSETYGYDNAGGVLPALPTTDDRLLLKLDAEIGDSHRATFTYTKDEAFTVNQTESNTNLFALSSTYLQEAQDVEGYSLQLHSDWSDRLSTDIKYALKEASNLRNPTNDQFAQFRVFAPGGGRLSAGPRFPFQQNAMNSDYEQLKLQGTYHFDRHSLKFGYESQETDTRNAFILFAPHGVYLFDDFAALENRTASNFTYENSPSGNPEDAAADWAYKIDSVYLQDTWSVTDNLTVEAGIRAEFFSSSDVPTLNSAYLARNGFGNDIGLDGQEIIQPRLGLVWDAGNLTTVRAGVGLFSGGVPNVWYNNAYGRNGVSTAAIIFTPCANLGTPADAALICENVDGFNVNPRAQELLSFGTGVAEAIDPNFNVPSSWKMSVGIEQIFDFSRVGLGDDWLVKADVVRIEVNDAVTVAATGQVQTGTDPIDGRPVFTQTGPRDLRLVNTGLGETTSWSITLNKAFESGWDLYLAYTSTDSKDADSNLGAVHNDVNGNVTLDLNNPRLARSSFEIGSRTVLGLSYGAELFGDHQTTFGLFGERRDGIPYGLVQPNTFGGTGQAPLFVDSNIYSAQQIAAAGLTAYTDQIVPRNALTAPTVTRFDLRISQEIPGLWEGSKGEIILDFDNIGNLLNSDWGLERTVSNDFGNGNGDAALAFGQDLQLQNATSFWSLQLGVRLVF